MSLFAFWCLGEAVGENWAQQVCWCLHETHACPLTRWAHSYRWTSYMSAGSHKYDLK